MNIAIRETPFVKGCFQRTLYRIVAHLAQVGNFDLTLVGEDSLSKVRWDGYPGDWDGDTIASFGLYYQDGEFYYRNDLLWNSGVYFNQSIGIPLSGVTQAWTWR